MVMSFAEPGRRKIERIALVLMLTHLLTAPDG